VSTFISAQNLVRSEVTEWRT